MGGLKERQESHYNGRLMGTGLRNPNFVKLAESYGAYGEQVASVKGLVPALESALKSDFITIIEVRAPDGFANLT